MQGLEVYERVVGVDVEGPSATNDGGRMQSFFDLRGIDEQLHSHIQVVKEGGMDVGKFWVDESYRVLLFLS
jgi:hypothetical protein